VQVFAAQVHCAVSQQTDVEREAEDAIKLFLGAGSGFACAVYFRLPEVRVPRPEHQASLV
jgi:hypothetical protein